MKPKITTFVVTVAAAGQIYIVEDIKNKHLKWIVEMLDGASAGDYTVTVKKYLFITHYSMRKHGL